VSAVVALGDGLRLAGYALVGVDVRAASDPEAARAAWAALPPDVALAILTPDARAALTERLHERPDLLWVTLPS